MLTMWYVIGYIVWIIITALLIEQDAHEMHPHNAEARQSAFIKDGMFALLIGLTWPITLPVLLVLVSGWLILSGLYGVISKLRNRERY